MQSSSGPLIRPPLPRRRSNALSTFVFRRPRVAATLSLWMLGLFIAFLAPAPVTITKEAVARYEHALSKAASQAPDLAAAERALSQASFAAANEASWFWRFQGPEKREAVHKARARERAARARLEKIYLKGDEAVAEGKQALGLWSQAGVDESRKTFKRAFESGKVFARRQTLWDGIMRALFDSREDRHPVVLIVELIATAVVNFASGAVMSVVVFASALPSLIRSYRPGFFSGVLFFFVALLGAVSAAAAFIGALAAAGAGAAYGVVSIAARPAIAAAERERREALNPPRAPPRPRAPLDPRRFERDYSE